ALLPFVVLAVFGSLIPVPVVPSLYPGELMLAVGYGILTTVAFSLWPLGRAHDVRASALFRDEVAPARVAPRLPYVMATVLAAIALAAFAIGVAYDRRIALVFVLSAMVVLLMLRLVASALMLVARRLPSPPSTVVRLALANIHRPGALTPTV